ncbi:hybrid sensor histidine kinase/response regulator transcription factor [Mucilaginibacter lacusdianchii]|uniref:hybrid sensor histidine kinase/response regulator transcription factor n=1 Tax=Mucilaginibacter lacusdianchii TaxID=2684211 RepID=UPI00131C8127|nr:two-component regulator propeller domain-containing protein [Mucilaginibacter sp. JXJ CY 39]
MQSCYLMLRNIVFALSLLFVCTCTVIGQVPKYQFTAISSKDGLASNTVNAILKDRYGFVWFGTEDGLTRFDGLNYTVYRHHAKDTMSLWSNEITSLYEDPFGQLWVGTSASLHLFDRKRNCFRHYKSNNEVNGFTNAVIKSICSDFEGKIWVATLGGLNKLDPKSGVITKFGDMRDVPDEIGHQSILTVYEDSQKRMWIGAKNGLYQYNRKTHNFTAFLPNISNSKNLAGGTVKAIVEDRQRNLWVGTSGGLSKLLPDGRSFSSIKEQTPAPGNLSNNIIYALALAGKDALWIGTEEGLNILNLQTGVIEHYLPDGRNSYSISGKSIRSILVDNQGIGWLGFYVAGVNKYDSNLTFFNLKRSNPYDAYGLSSPFVTSFAQGNGNQIFVGTDGGGLSSFDTQSGLFKRYPLTSARKRPGSNFSILALKRTRNGDLWAGTFQDGVFKINPTTGAVKQFLKGTGNTTINHDEIFCLEEDKSGRIWIGTNGGGVDIYDPKTGTFKFYVPFARAADEFSLPLNGYIRDFEEDEFGRMWIASHGMGIGIFDPKNEQFTVLSHLAGNLPSNLIQTLYKDGRGNMWAGTGDGLLKINVRTRQVETFGAEHGLVDGIVHKILEDKLGRIWFSTNRGVSWIDPNRKVVTNYNSVNGLQGGSFEQGAGLVDHNGVLFFGGTDGFNYIQPANGIRENKNPTPVIFTSLKIDDKEVTSAGSDMLQTDISIAESIRLNYKQNFSISFVGLNFTSTRQNHYYYRLKGFDKDWINAGTKTTAYYTNLSPGEYAFEVKAANNDGFSNKGVKSINITIRPPFWMTIYAYLFYITAACSLLLWIRHRGIQKLRRTFKQEEARREAERLHELDRLKIKFLTNLSHDFRTPIALIMAPIDKLLSQRLEDGIDTQLMVIKRNARRLLNIVNQLFDLRKIEEGEMRLNPIKADIIAFQKEVSEAFYDLSEKKRIAFVFKSSISSLQISFDPDKLERILFNLLSNAFKFTMEGGKVMLITYLKQSTTDTDQSNLVIEVTDTGIGIDESQQQHIFTRFYQNQISGNVFNQGSGIGLSIVKEFVELHGGTVELQSEPGKGSSFCIYLPVDAEAAQPKIENTPDDEITDKTVSDTEMQSVLQPVKENNVKAATLPIVLIIEDNEDFRFYLRDNLCAHYKVIEAADGKEGWQKALSVHPEVIVSDIMMPHMDGIQLSQKLKADKRTSHIPVILLTASTREEEQINGLASGANDYLTKPFSFGILVIKINNLLAFNRTLKSTYTKQLKVEPAQIKVESVKEKFLKMVVTYVEENLHNTQLSVEDLSRHIGMSRGSLYNKLLEITGLSPVEFIRSIKLEKAAMLLEDSDMNIAQIAYAAGFSTPNYFAKSFKAKYQMLPSEYLSQKRKTVAHMND